MLSDFFNKNIWKYTIASLVVFMFSCTVLSIIVSFITLEKIPSEKNYIEISNGLSLLTKIISNNIRIFAILLISLLIGRLVSILAVLATLLTLSYIIGISQSPVNTILILAPHGLLELLSYHIMIGLNFSIVKYPTVSPKRRLKFILLSFSILCLAALLETILSIRF